MQFQLQKGDVKGSLTPSLLGGVIFGFLLLVSCFHSKPCHASDRNLLVALEAFTVMHSVLSMLSFFCPFKFVLKSWFKKLVHYS